MGKFISVIQIGFKYLQFLLLACLVFWPSIAFCQLASQDDSLISIDTLSTQVEPFDSSDKFKDTSAYNKADVAEKPSQRNSGKLLHKSLESNFGLFLIMMVIMAVLSFLFITEYTYIAELMRGIADLNYLELMNREGKLGIRFANILLDLLYITCISIVLFVLQQTWLNLALWLVWLVVAAFVLLQQLFMALMGIVFYGNKGLVLIFLSNLVYIRFAAIISTPAVFLSFYFDYSIQKYLFWAILILNGIFIALRSFRILFQMKASFDYGLFYNFFYLCTVEFAPIIVALQIVANFS